jgi:hypothetical protein
MKSKKPPLLAGVLTLVDEYYFDCYCELNRYEYHNLGETPALVTLSIAWLAR